MLLVDPDSECALFGPGSPVVLGPLWSWVPCGHWLPVYDGTGKEGPAGHTGLPGLTCLQDTPAYPACHTWQVSHACHTV